MMTVHLSPSRASTSCGAQGVNTALFPFLV